MRLIIINIIVFCGFGFHSLYGHLFPEKGILDLREAEYSEEFLYSLNGEWGFYWEKFADRSEIRKTNPDLYIEVPSYWSDAKLNGEKLSSTGYATYHLQIILGADFNSQFSFRVPVFDDSYRFYINDSLLSQNGKPARSKELTVPAYSREIVSYKPLTDTLDLLIHCSNYYHRRGGFWREMKIGDPAKILLLYHRQNLVSHITLGILAAFSLFFLFFYLLYPSKKFLLFFSLFVFGFFARLMSIGDFPVLLIYELPWRCVIRVEYIGTFLSLIMAGWYFYSVYPQRIIKKLNWINTLLSIVIIIIIKVTEVRVFSYSSLYFQSIGLLMGGYYFVHSLRKFIKERSVDDALFFSGLVVIVIVLINDICIANANNFVATSSNYSIHFAIVYFVFIQALILIRAWIMAYREKELLNIEIRYLNENLENLIEQRTLEINEKKEQIKDKNERLQKTLAFKNKLISIIAHDLKSPVASILQISEYLKLKNRNKELNPVVDSMQQLSESASDLIDNLLVWGRSQDNRLKVNRSRIELSRIIDDTLDLFYEAADQKEIEIRFEKRADLQIDSDPELLKIILRNLISNAIKFTGRDGTVIIEMKKLNTSGQVVISINDNGTGIEKELLNKILYSETLVSTYGTSNEKGTGLGLRLCLELVSLLNGKMDVSSEQGEGTAIDLYLPAISEKK